MAFEILRQNMRLRWKKFLRSMTGFSGDERRELYTNIAEILRNDLSVYDSFMQLSKSAAIAGNGVRKSTYEDIAGMVRRSDSPEVVSRAIADYIPKSEADILIKSESAGTLEKMLEYMVDITETNSRISKAMLAIYFAIASRVAMVLLALYFIKPFLVFLSAGQPHKLRTGTFAAPLYSAGEWTEQWGAFIGLAIIGYVVFYVVMRDRRPLNIRKALGYFPLFFTYQNAVSTSELISLSVQLYLAEDAVESEIVERTSKGSIPWANYYYSVMISELRSGRKTLEGAMASSPLFPPALRSRIAAIQAVKADDAGLIEAALEAARGNAKAIEQKAVMIRNVLSIGFMVVMVMGLMATNELMNFG